MSASVGDAINHVVDTVSNALASKAPAAWHLLVANEHIKGLISYKFALMEFTIAAVLLCIAIPLAVYESVADRKHCRVVESWRNRNELHHEYTYKTPIFGVSGIIIGIVGLIFLLVATVNIFDSDLWRRLNCPECVAAETVLNSVH